MTLNTIILLFISMLILALIPGPGVLLVVARTLSSHFRHGAITTLGIVCGDYIFILLAIYGLVAIANTMGNLFIIIKYIGAAYLIFLGVQLFRSPPSEQTIEQSTKSTYLADFLSGLMVTLSNPKAILFYLSFFPALLDLSSMPANDIAIILLTATFSIGGVMLGYAYLTTQVSHFFKNKHFNRLINTTAGGVMIGSGTLMALRN